MTRQPWGLEVHYWMIMGFFYLGWSWGYILKRDPVVHIQLNHRVGRCGCWFQTLSSVCLSFWRFRQQQTGNAQGNLHAAYLSYCLMPPFASHIFPGRWDGSAPVSALELTQSRACPLCWHSLCCLTALLGLFHRRMWAQKAAAWSPPFGILWEKQVQREDEASVHPGSLALRSTLEGKGWVMVLLGQNHCRARRLERVYFFLLLKTWRIIWFGS